jgi:hypothetical protein
MDNLCGSLEKPQVKRGYTTSGTVCECIGQVFTIPAIKDIMQRRTVRSLVIFCVCRDLFFVFCLLQHNKRAIDLRLKPV